ncbi:MAG: hypothetical protein PXZ07_04520 [Candidatus Eremiobacteraeota bacterium]|nr:hypothetical protein [Candidatus Eremiobacteraeota bacterium]
MRESEKNHRDEHTYIVVAADATTTDTLCADYGVAGACIADPQRITHRAARLRPASILTFFSRDLIRRAVENHRAGFRQNWAKTRIDDLGRVPGAMRIDANGKVVWIYRGRHAGDLPPIEDLLTR